MSTCRANGAAQREASRAWAAFLAARLDAIAAFHRIGDSPETIVDALNLQDVAHFERLLPRALSGERN